MTRTHPGARCASGPAWRAGGGRAASAPRAVGVAASGMRLRSRLLLACWGGARGKPQGHKRAQKTVLHNSFNILETFRDGKYMHATTYEHGDPQQRSRYPFLWLIQHHSVHAPPPRPCHRASWQAARGHMRAGHTLEQTGSEAQGIPHGALTGSFVASHNPEITSPQRLACERSVRARRSRQRPDGGLIPAQGFHGACLAPLLRLHGDWQA